MDCLLSHSFDSEGAVFNCLEKEKPVPVSTWGHSAVHLRGGNKASIGVLNLMLEEERASKTDNELSVRISYDELACLESWQAKGLGLPSVAPFRLVIVTHGTLASNNFRVEYGYTYPDSVPASNAIRNGAIVNCGTKQYILPDPLYSAVKLLDEYQSHPITEMDQRFLWWGKVRELLPDDANIGNFLRTINIVKPESFTVDFTEKEGDIQITPRFVFPPESIDGDELEDNQGEPQNLIPPVVHEAFNADFLQKPSVKVRYALSNRWFVVLPQTLRTALQAVRDVNSASTEAKRAFLYNPKAALLKIMEDEVDDEILESLFVETPLFLNERIKCLGIWQPKSGLFIKTESGQWLPEEGPPPIIGIPLNGGIYTVKTSDLTNLHTVLKEAKQEGRNQVKYGNIEFPVNDESINAIGKAAKAFEPPEKPGGKEEDQADEAKKGETEKLVPLIYDHIEELGIIVDQDGYRTPIFESEPKLESGIRLHRHQEEGLEWLKEHWRRASSGAFLADDMGLGKTLQTLAFMSWVKLQMDSGFPRRNPFLVVAPTLLLDNWVAEAEKFLPPPRLGSLFRAHGPKFRSLVQEGWAVASSECKEAGWVITTYETLRDKIMAFTGIHWSVAVFDEAQKIKNPKAMVTDMAKSIKAQLSLALTGTPVENSLIDLWCIADAVQPGRLNTLKEFSGTFMPRGMAGNDELKKLKLELDSPLEYSLMLRRSKDEHWKEKPDKKESSHEVEMPQEQALSYSAAVEYARNADGRKGAMLEALQSLRAISLHPHLQQNPPENDDDFINASARLIATFKILDELYRQNEKALIFVEYLKMQAAISEIIERRYCCSKVLIINGKVSGAKRQARVNEFQSGKPGFEVIILSPKAGGVGINLTAATHVIHLSRWWNPAVEDQCSDRAYRIGQHKPVTIHYPLAIHPDYGYEQSFDIKLHDLLQRKRYLSKTLLAPPAGKNADVNWLFEQSVKVRTDSAGRRRPSFEKEKDEGQMVDLERIDLMEPIEFETWVLGTLKQNGYEVKTTPFSGDAGADGIAISPDSSHFSSYIIQCKHTQRDVNIGHSAVEEVLNAINRYEVLPKNVQALVVTNAKEFTAKARSLARNHSVQLVSRKELKNFNTFFSEKF